MKVNDKRAARQMAQIPMVPGLGRGTVLGPTGLPAAAEEEVVREELHMRLVPTNHPEAPIALQFSQPVSTLPLSLDQAERIAIQFFAVVQNLRGALNQPSPIASAAPESPSTAAAGEERPE